MFSSHEVHHVVVATQLILLDCYHPKHHGHLVVCRNLRCKRIDQMLSESTVYIVPTACACLEARKVQLFGAIEAVGKMSDLPERFLTPATATTLRLSL